MSNFVPLSELPSTLEEGSRLAWQFEPSMYVDRERIGLNLNWTERTAKMAGFGGVIVKNYFGEQTTYDTNAVSLTGINVDGSATGTADTPFVKAETENAYLEEETRLAPEYRWPTAIVNINRNELASRISDRIHRGIARDEAWAQELNRSLRRGLTSAAKTKLANDMALEPGSSIFVVGMSSLFVMQAAYLALSVTLPLWHASRLFMSSEVNKAVAGDHCLERKRLSIFPGGMQPDRFVLAAGMAASRRLVRYRK